MVARIDLTFRPLWSLGDGSVVCWDGNCARTSFYYYSKQYILIALNVLLMIVSTQNEMAILQNPSHWQNLKSRNSRVQGTRTRIEHASRTVLNLLLRNSLWVYRILNAQNIGLCIPLSSWQDSKKSAIDRPISPEPSSSCITLKPSNMRLASNSPILALRSRWKDRTAIFDSSSIPSIICHNSWESALTPTYLNLL